MYICMRFVTKTASNVVLPSLQLSNQNQTRYDIIFWKITPIQCAHFPMQAPSTFDVYIHDLRGRKIVVTIRPGMSNADLYNETSMGTARLTMPALYLQILSDGTHPYQAL